MTAMTDAALKIQRAFPSLTWRQCLKQAAHILEMVRGGEQP